MKYNMVVFVGSALATLIVVAIIGLLLFGLVVSIIPTIGLVVAGILLFVIVLQPSIPDFKLGPVSVKTVFAGVAVIFFLIPFVGGFFSITPQEISDNTVGLLSIAQKSISGELIADTVKIDPFIFFIGVATSLIGGLLGQGLLVVGRRRR